MQSRAADWPPGVGEALDEVVRRIVELVRPQAVLVFGSRAEGRAGEHSDLDLLVIADTTSPGQVTEDLYAVVADVRDGRWDEVPPFDVVVMTPAEWRHESQLPGQLAFRAKRHGVTVHGRAA